MVVLFALVCCSIEKEHSPSLLSAFPLQTHIEIPEICLPQRKYNLELNVFSPWGKTTELLPLLAAVTNVNPLQPHAKPDNP